MDDYYEYDRQFQEKKQKEAISKDKFAKNKLKKTVETSLRTVSIGALSDFEHFFGDLFGYGQDYNTLSDEQKELRKDWAECRNSILQRCANAVNISLSEVERCEIKEYHQKRYDTIIKPKGYDNDTR